MKIEWKDLAEGIGRIAPLIGTAIGGPAGGAVGGLVSAALGVGNSPDDVQKALETDPNAAVKIKQLQVEQETMLKKHIEAMANIELKYEETRVEERKSAHSREVELAKAGKDNTIQPALAIVGVLAFFGLAVYVVVEGLPNMTKEESFIVGTVIGSVMMIGKDIYGYYFGSSSGSKSKTDLLGKK